MKTGLTLQATGVALAILLSSSLSIAQVDRASEDLLRKRFADLISKWGEEKCAEVSYFEFYERDSIYEQWDARCISGREYRIFLPLIAQAKTEARPCGPEGTPGIDCFNRARRSRDTLEHIDLFTMRARTLIEGTWLGPSPLQVRGGSISWANCRNVPISIFTDRARMAVERRSIGARSGAAALAYDVNVREIAVELRRDDKCRKSKEPLGDVLVFAITNIGLVEATDASCTSRVRIYRTRSDFENAPPAIEVQLRKDICEYRD